jgi:hypothetical protein
MYGEKSYKLHLLNGNYLMNRDSSVGTATGYGLNDWCSIPGRGKKLFTCPQCLDRLWGPPSLPCNGYEGAVSVQLKRPGRVAAEMKNGGTISHSPSTGTALPFTFTLKVAG